MPRTQQAPAEAVGELKFGQVGVANLRLRAFDPEGLRAELAQKVRAAPHLFARTPVVVDLSRLTRLPDTDEVRALLAAVREAGMLPVGLSYGSAENEQLARALDLPLFEKFRAAFERIGAAEPAPPSAPTPVASAPPAAAGNSVGQHHVEPVRSGQQVYARGRDLTLTAMVGNGAEVIADGSIHIYATLRGRALAGAQGDTTARIFCQNFQAELISIAGQYRVFEDIPTELHGKPVQAWLEGEKLLLARLG